MLRYCESCGARDALLLYHRDRQGQMVLCPSCAEREGFNALAFPARQPGSKPLNIQVTIREIELDHVVSCPGCGMTMHAFIAAQAYGCPACKGAFAHTEAVPAIPGLGLALKLAELKISLEAAVAAENFEQAARIRDIIINVRDGQAGSSLQGVIHV